MSLKNIKPGRVVFTKIPYEPWWPSLVNIEILLFFFHSFFFFFWKIIDENTEELGEDVLREKKQGCILVKYITKEWTEFPY